MASICAAAFNGFTLTLVCKRLIGGGGGGGGGCSELDGCIKWTKAAALEVDAVVVNCVVVKEIDDIGEEMLTIGDGPAVDMGLKAENRWSSYNGTVSAIGGGGELVGEFVELDEVVGCCIGDNCLRYVCAKGSGVGGGGNTGINWWLNVVAFKA